MRSQVRSGSLPLARPEFGTDDLAAVGEVMASGWLGRGPVADRFEEELARLLGARHVVATSTGTAAIQLALEAVGVRPGDEVVVPSLTFAATYQSVVACGARPVFVDVDPETWCCSPDDVEARMGPATRAVLTVHLCGFPGHRDELADVAAERGVAFVEDAAHAVGSGLPPANGGARPVGSTGNAVAFSFDPIKSLSCGQGGAVAVGDERTAAEVRRRSDLGLAPEGGERHVVGSGHRFAMSDMNAAIGLSQLARFDRTAARRRELLVRYRSALGGMPGVVLPAHDPSLMVPFTLMVRVPAASRAAVRAALAAEGIETGFHYHPGHLQPAFAGSAPLPVTERLAQELVTLPFFPSMRDDEVDRVADALYRAPRA